MKTCDTNAPKSKQIILNISFKSKAMEEDTDKNQRAVKKMRRDEFMHKLEKYREQKQKTLKESNRNVVVSNDKRKSEGSLPVENKKPKLQAPTNKDKVKPQAAAHKVHVKKPAEVQKSSTPMSIKLQRWKEQKKMKENNAAKNDSKKSGQTDLQQENKVSKFVPKPAPKQTFYTRHSAASSITNVHKNLPAAKNHRASLPAENFNKKFEYKVHPTHVSDKTLVNSKQKYAPAVTKAKNSTTVTNQTTQHNRYQGSVKNHVNKMENRPHKRRHSEASTAVVDIKKKKPGILKRKSCIASFSESMMDKVDKEHDSQTSDSQHTSSDDDNVFTSCTKTPDHGRSVRFISPTDGRNFASFELRKTPVKRLNQASMRSKLDSWLKTKGKTPSKFRHLMCFDAHLSAKKCKQSKRSLTVDELTEQQEAMEREDKVAVNLASALEEASEEDEEDTDPLTLDLDTMLEECSTLFKAGLPLEDTLKWLDSLENIPIAKQSSRFYICKATVLQSTNDLEKVLEVFETAVINNAKPSDELAKSLTAIIKEISEEREKQARQSKQLEKQVQKENIFESSSIKYCVRQVTPFSKRKRKSTSDVQQSSRSTSPCAVVTPVRRSTRRSLASLPESLHEKKQLFDNLEDLSDADKKNTLYQPNEALATLLDEDTE